MTESYDEGGDFEYDEASESADESEAMDEASEAYDEMDEAMDESADEADESADEYAAADESADESEAADEGADEAAVDEASDEAYDEALSASARLRSDRDRNRRASWARRIAADQRLEAQRAASTQRSITSQTRAIQPGSGAKVSSVGTLQGVGVVTAILPNGRRSRMRIIPTLAPVREVNRLRSVLLTNERRQALATSRNSRAIRALAATQVVGVKKITAMQVKSDRDLGKPTTSPLKFSAR
jgi:hypothetical protein